MGRKNRHRRQTKPASDDGSNDGLDSGGKERYEGQLGSHAVRGRSYTSDAPAAHHSSNNDSPHRLRKAFRVCSYHNRPPSQYASTSRSVDPDALVVISRLLRQEFLLSYERTLKQFEQWWCDDDSSEDKMDWQPEAELLLPSRTEGIISLDHAWKPAPMLEGQRRKRRGSDDVLQ